MDELNSMAGRAHYRGWQERELEDEEARQALRLPVLNLKPTHARSGSFRRTRSLVYRRKQDARKRLQGIYRQRLKAELKLARRFWHKALSDDLLAPELQHLIETIRALDQHHASRLAEIQASLRQSTICSLRCGRARTRGNCCRACTM